MMRESVLGIARHLLTIGGGWLVAHGHLAETDVQTLVGAGLALIGIAWSVWDKKTRT